MASIFRLPHSTGEHLMLLQYLRHKFGNEINCEELEQRLVAYKHKCPQCKGKGTVEEHYNSYPSGLPDSGWVYQDAVRHIKCSLCGGDGYTEKEYKPHMVQDGWEEA